MEIIKGSGKIAAAGILAVIILSLLMCFYSLSPVHIENEKGNTDYVWPANAVWVMATEGISRGKFDANGFNNLSVVEDPDIIVLGSSHMEACEVSQNQTAAYLLGEKLRGRFSVYNMGISGHGFYKSCQYLPADLELYDMPPKAVILETSNVSLQQENVTQVLNGTVERTPSHSTGLIAALQKIPFLRTVYQQIDHGLLDLFMPESSSEEERTAKTAPEDLVVSGQGSDDVDEKAYAALFEYLSDAEKRYGTQIIIFYHPTGTILADGTVFFNNGASLRAFEEYADTYDISFVDMTPAFENMFYTEHHVAHGFVTGKLETGHLNRFGHEAVAEALYEEVMKMEEDGLLCQ